MEKCRKLSLKNRKTLSINNSLTKNLVRSNVKSIPDPSQSDVIDLDDDEESDRASVTEQRQPTDVENPKCKLPETKDPNLDKLRDLIMRVSSNHRVNGSPLKPFPAYTVESFDNPQIKEGRLLSSACFSIAKDGLTPFPSLPARYLQRKRQKKGEDKNLAEKEADTPKEESSHMTKRMSDKQNVASSASSVPTENSHLMRDRNSNLYSLQTRNNKHSHNGIDTVNVNQPSSSTSSNTAKSTQSSGSSSFNSAQNNLKTSSVSSSSSTAQTVDRNKSAQKDFKRIGVEKGQNKSYAQKGKTCSSTQGLSGSTAFKGLKRSNAQITDCEASTSYLPTNLDSRTKNNQKSIKLNDAKYSDLNTEPEIKRFEKDVNIIESEEVISGLPMPKPSASDQKGLETDMSKTSVSIPERRGPDMLKTCPLCQTEFSKNSTQMDIDSHIAQCLSNSEDDVMW